MWRCCTRLRGGNIFYTRNRGLKKRSINLTERVEESHGEKCAWRVDTVGMLLLATEIHTAQSLFNLLYSRKRECRYVSRYAPQCYSAQKWFFIVNIWVRLADNRSVWPNREKQNGKWGYTRHRSSIRCNMFLCSHGLGSVRGRALSDMIGLCRHRSGACSVGDDGHHMQRVISPCVRSPYLGESNCEFFVWKVFGDHRRVPLTSIVGRRSHTDYFLVFCVRPG